MNEEDFFVINAIENIHQKPTSLLEFGRVCKILRKTMSVSQIAARLSIPKGRVESALTEISKIPEKYRGRIRLMSNET
jgi:hypothetical protein